MSRNAPSPPSEEEEHSPPQDLSASGLTIPSDSEAFSSLSPPSSSPPQSSSNNNNNNNQSHEQKVVIYSRPTFWTLLRGAAINLLLPFVNGMMLGLGELLAHEVAFRWGWNSTQVSRWCNMNRYYRERHRYEYRLLEPGYSSYLSSQANPFMFVLDIPKA